MTKASNKSSKSANPVTSVKPVGVDSSRASLPGNVIPFKQEKAHLIGALCNSDLPVDDELFQFMEQLETSRAKALSLWNGLEGALWVHDDLIEAMAQEKLEWVAIKTRLSSAEITDYILAEHGSKYSVEDVDDLLNCSEKVVASQSLLMEQLSANWSTMMAMSDTMLTLCALKIAREAAND